MTLNPPKMVRTILYVLTAVGTPLVAYLNDKGILGATEVTLWSAEVAVVLGLAAINTSSRTADAPAAAHRLDERGATLAETILIVLGIITVVVLLALLLGGGTIRLG